MLGDFDYDFDINKQFGEAGEFRALGNRQNAVQTTVQYAMAYEIDAGYTFSDHPWKPRIGVYTYGSGNVSPFDSVNQNFDIFYGFNQPFSRNDYMAWNNLKAPKVRLEFTPVKGLQIDTALGPSGSQALQVPGTAPILWRRWAIGERSWAQSMTSASATNSARSSI